MQAGKLRHLSIQGPTSSAGVSNGKTSTGFTSSSTASKMQNRSSSTAISNDHPYVVHIEIRDRDALKPGTRVQLLNPLPAQSQSASSGPASSRPQKPAKK